jgi:threonine aldolase
MFGGAMRQSGILAAAGIYALENHVDRLRDDHSNAKLLAQGLASVNGIRVETTEPPTNIVFFEVTEGRLTGNRFHVKTQAAGVRFSGIGSRVRAVTHLDVTRADIERAADIVSRVVGGR